MLDKVLGWMGLGRKSIFGAWLVSKGGTFTDLAALVKSLEAFGGAWSFTFTVLDDGTAEAHLLQVVMGPAQWKGKGYRRPKKDAPEEAQVDRKAIYKGPVEEFAGWVAGLEMEMVKASMVESAKKLGESHAKITEIDKEIAKLAGAPKLEPTVEKEALKVAAEAGPMLEVLKGDA